MTTKPQIKKLVKPLLEQHPDLVLDGQWLYLKPVRHILRTLLFDRTGDAKRFRPKWAVIILFRPTDRIDIKYGEYLSSREGRLWFWADPAMPSVLFDAIE